ncbi:MAG: MFS transporter [Moraxellaceae bacterium]|nr:MFS transporter [Moraxellaceae bacterium]
MTSGERRAVVTLASLFSLRMIGLFMIMPVFALYGRELTGATPLLIGLAIRVYGLAQAFLQIPLGLLADRMDRKKLILAGLVLFAVGGAVAAMSDHIYGVIVGRAIQGAGAISGVVMALLADLTREEQRTKAMASIGASIGLSFGLAFVLGPWLTGMFGLHGLFWSTVLLGIAGMAVCQWLVPRPLHHVAHTPASYGQQLRESLRHAELLRLNAGIFTLHAVMTACFTILPLLLLNNGGLEASRHGWVYLPVLFGSFFAIVPAIIMAERKRRMRGVFLTAIGILAVGLSLLAGFHDSLWALVGGMLVFFIGFNLLEALLPSLVSKLCPAGGKGTAMGIYSSSQFFGAFVGGVLGGFLQTQYGIAVLFAVLAAMVLLWWGLAVRMPPPPFLTSVMLRLETASEPVLSGLAAQLQGIAGVKEVVVLPVDTVAYLRVDPEEFLPESLSGLPVTISS